MRYLVSTTALCSVSIEVEADDPDPESDGAPLRIAWALAAREIQRARARRGAK